MQSSDRSCRGHTLFELLLTLTIASVVLVVALPSVGAMVARSRQSAEINALFHAVHLARKESIMRRRVVSLCPSVDGRQCQPGHDWSGGWLMFENQDGDEPPMVDGGEAILGIHTTHDSVRIVANRRGFTLRATFLRATNGTFVICDRAARIPPKALVVSYTGRPRVAFETSSGASYACAD
jgi:type IV fimbrial biogenesis protein FimT